jgi:hypothetical protein
MEKCSQESKDEVVICKITSTNQHNKTQEETLLQSLFCTHKKSTKFRRSDDLYRKDVNCVISYIHADFEGILT